MTDQTPSFLQLLEREGLKPGSRLTVEVHEEAADAVSVRTAAGNPVRLGSAAAAKILVRDRARPDA